MFKQIAWGILIFSTLLVGPAWADEALNKELSAAVLAGDKAKVEALIAKGADVNAKTDDGFCRGCTPLHIAARAGRVDVAELLIAKGADVNAKTKYELVPGLFMGGETPLHLASMSTDTEKLLIAKGADVNAKDVRGQTPLHYRAKNSSYNPVVELMIAKGADVNAKDNDGNTPLHIAASTPNEQLAELFIAKGADVNAKNKKGETPLQVMDSVNTKGRLCLLPNYDPDQDCIITKKSIMAALMQGLKGNGLDSQQLLNSYLEQFKGHPGNDELRAAIIDVALKQRPSPVIPPEAEAAAGRGAYLFKNAKSGDDTLSAAKEYLTAIETAPWVANYYYNLCTVLEKSPYSQQALHACKLYLVAAPNAADAGDMKQRIAGLQYAADRDKAQMKQRTVYIKSRGTDDLYRYGGISDIVSGKDMALKLVVDWYSAPPKYQIYVGCIEGDGIYGTSYDLVSTDIRLGMCHQVVNMHLVIKPEGEGFVELSDASGGSIRTTLNELFKAKQKIMAQAVMSSASGDQRERFYVTYMQGGIDDKHAGYAMFESDCNGSVLKQDPRALPDDFLPFEMTKKGQFGRFVPEAENSQPIVDLCARRFSSKTGYHFGELE